MYKYPIILIFLTLVTYLNILPNQLFFDDEELIYKNVYVQNIRYLPKFFTENMVAGAGKISNMYRPVLMTSFSLDHLFWKNNPTGYHLTSIFLHVANAILIFYLVNHLFKLRLLSFLTSVLFIIHPIQSEAVIYASGKTDPLYSFFFLLSLFFFVKGKSFVTLIFFLLSLLSKETAIILPLVLLLVYFLFEKQYTRKSQKLALLTSFFIAVSYIFLRLTVLNFSNTVNFYQSENLYSQNLLIRMYTFTRVFFEYLILIIFPKDLMIARQVSVITSFSDPYVISFIFLFVTLFVLTLRYFKKDPLYFFSFSWFFITILPTSGIIPINNVIAEHYLYLPSLAFYLLMAKILTGLMSKMVKKWQQIILVFFITIVFTTLTIRTVIRTFDWRDPITFYTKSLIQSPDNLPMRNNLAMAYSEKGMLEEAVDEYKKTIALGDVYPNVHHNLANVYKEQGKYKEAEEEYFKALALDPKFYFSYGGLADLYRRTGEKEKLNEILKNLK